ncbi:hypothetical protein SAMN00777080_2839 [Aquiflexum balticum DSM 16537]|uniref:Uncharacterized protein n=1 Tax=Aquiflexum balticum DSM 16537 TaxID=758820 RepID=A0A1W2H5S5_9BACT|nr:hypothetical protein SAMN00777080_2839 [Aquiflexum balticum DSM 16537]
MQKMKPFLIIVLCIAVCTLFGQESYTPIKDTLKFIE